MKEELGIWDPPEARWSRPLNEGKVAGTKSRKDVDPGLNPSS